MRSVVMKNRNVRIIAAFAVILLASYGISKWYQRYQRNKELQNLVSSSPSPIEALKDQFKYEIPQNAETVELKDITGGGSSAIFVKEKSADKFNYTVLSDMPDLTGGSVDSAWRFKTIDTDEYTKLGNLTVAKGGYLLDIQSSNSYQEYKFVVISKETKNDSIIEEKILEGEIK